MRRLILLFFASFACFCSLAGAAAADREGVHRHDGARGAPDGAGAGHHVGRAHAGAGGLRRGHRGHHAGRIGSQQVRPPCSLSKDPLRRVFSLLRWWKR